MYLIPGALLIASVHSSGTLDRRASSIQSPFAGSSAPLITLGIVAAIIGVICCVCLYRQKKLKSNPKPSMQSNYPPVVSSAPIVSTGINLNGSQQPTYVNSYPGAYGSQPPAPLFNTRAESLIRANEFYRQYPVGSAAALESAAVTARLPSSMEFAQLKFSMLKPRLYSHFPFPGTRPNVEIGPMQVSSGQQSIKFKINQDVCIQSNQALIPHRNPDAPPLNDALEADQCYFKVKILEADPSATIAIGFATCPYAPFRLPGWDYNSIAIHSNDGSVFMNNAENGYSTGRSLQAGDEVGVGYYVETGYGTINCKFYFTINGVKVNQEFGDGSFVPHQIFPTIGSDGNCSMQVTFGDVRRVFFPMNHDTFGYHDMLWI